MPGTADLQIINEIILKGVAQVKKDFADMGAAGEKAGNQITGAFNELSGVGGDASKSLDEIGKGAQGVNLATAALSGLNATGKATRQTLQQFLPVVTQTQNLFQRLAGAFTGVVAGLRGTADASEDVSGKVAGANRNAVAFGTTLRLLGRATGERQLSQLGRTVSILGRAFVIAAPAILAVGLERIAAAATTAASVLADLAGNLRLSTSQMAILAALGTSTGLTQDKLGTSLTAVNKLIKDTADAETAATKTQADFNDQISASREAANDMGAGFELISTKSQALNVDLLHSKITLDQYTQGQKDLRKESRALSDQIDKQDEATRKLERSMQLANIAAINDGTALQKLGISALDTSGKLKKAPEVLNQIADALKALPAGADKTNIEFDLIAAGLDRKLLPALRQGSAAFKDIAEKSRTVNPGFTDAQIKTADDFAISVQGASDAWTSLVNAMGIAIAPAFVPLFQKISDLLVEIRPGLAEFGAALANVVGPILTGIATIIQIAIIPALSALIGLFQLIADGINAVFGTKVTGMQLFVAVLLAVSVAFGGIATAVTVLITGIGLLVNALQQSGATWQSVVDLFTSTFKSITDGITALWSLIVQSAASALSSVEGFFTSLGDRVVSVFTQIRDFILNVWSQVKDVIAKLTGGGDAGDTAVAKIPGLAGGGPIRGAGSGTSDSNLVWASHGEFIQRAAAVRKYGLNFMHAINSLKFDPNAFFSMGGTIPFSQPKMRFAEGGLVQTWGGGPRNVLNLRIGNEQFDGLSVEDETMEKLTRFSVRAQVRSGGRKPKWK